MRIEFLISMKIKICMSCFLINFIFLLEDIILIIKDENAIYKDFFF